MAMRRKPRWIVLGFAALLFFAIPAFAQTDPQGILQDYATASTNWQNAIAPYAYNLFKLLAAVDFAWTCIVVALEKQDMQGVVAAIIKKLMTIGFFWILLAFAPQWFPLIIQSFVQVGGAGSGRPTPMNPSTILEQGIDIAKYLFNGAAGSNLLLSPATALALILAGLGIVLSYLVITIHFIMAMVESYIVIGAGYIFLGFGGSRWTSTYVERYVSLVISIGARLMVLYLVIGVGQTFATQWVAEAQIAATGAISGHLGCMGFDVPSGHLWRRLLDCTEARGQRDWWHALGKRRRRDRSGRRGGDGCFQWRCPGERDRCASNSCCWRYRRGSRSSKCGRSCKQSWKCREGGEHGRRCRPRGDKCCGLQRKWCRIFCTPDKCGGESFKRGEGP